MPFQKNCPQPSRNRVPCTPLHLLVFITPLITPLQTKRRNYIGTRYTIVDIIYLCIYLCYKSESESSAHDYMIIRESHGTRVRMSRKRKYVRKESVNYYWYLNETKRISSPYSLTYFCILLFIIIIRFRMH